MWFHYLHRSIVQRYTAEWEKTVTRLGRWIDFKNDYKTMDPEYMESVWYVRSNEVFSTVSCFLFSIVLTLSAIDITVGSYCDRCSVS